MKKYPIVRIYGMGCDMIPNAVKLAKENNQKIFAGIWTTNGQDSENVDTVVQALASAIQTYNGGNWDIIGLVSVENERVNDKALTASAVADKIRQARAALQTAGYNGPIGAVETVSAMLDHPVVCESSDIALVNVHAFFDNNTKARDAGKFVKGQVERVKKACGGKRVIVTESGWPHQGEANGAAVPSYANQQAAMDSILGHFDHDVFLFNAFDTPWKSDWAGSFSAERYWGMFQ
jgi:exo-beta-1,3-glucanase (GH17 family)